MTPEPPDVDARRVRVMGNRPRSHQRLRVASLTPIARATRLGVSALSMADLIDFIFMKTEIQVVLAVTNF